MDEDKIIGPFTLRQFIAIALGLLLAKLASEFLPDPFAIPGAAVIAAGAVVLVWRLEPPKIDEKAIRAKRFTFSKSEDYLRWLNTKRAIVESQKNERKRRGFVPDPKLEHIAGVLETCMRETQDEQQKR